MTSHIRLMELVAFARFENRINKKKKKIKREREFIIGVN